MIVVRRDVRFVGDVRARMLRGLDAVADAMKVTLGPKGRDVVVHESWPRITEDAALVAKTIELSDEFERMGARLVREVAFRTHDVAGDGAVTTTVLAQEILRQGAKAVDAGMNPIHLKHGIDQAVTAVVKDLKRHTRKVTTRVNAAQIERISASGEAAIGRAIAEAIYKVGSNGVITVDEGVGVGTAVNVVQGFQFDRGYISPYFITNARRMLADLDSPYVLTYGGTLRDLRPMLPLLETIAQSSRPLLIIAEDVEGEALATLIVNKLRGGLKVAVARAPNSGIYQRAMLEDIAILTAGQVISQDVGIKLENVKLNMLGRAKKVLIDKESTTIVEVAGRKYDIEGRRDQIRGQIDQTTNKDDLEKLRERLEKLTRGIAVIRVGGATDVEIEERKDRAVYALRRTRAAFEEGIVPGGGVALARASLGLANLKSKNDDQRFGIEIVRRALQSPLRQIAENAGEDGAVIASKILNRDEYAWGFDAQAGEFKDMVGAGIIDSVKVVRTALQDAASVARVFMTTGSIAEEKAMIAEEAMVVENLAISASPLLFPQIGFGNDLAPSGFSVGDA